jgi:hypothetical protein
MGNSCDMNSSYTTDTLTSATFRIYKPVAYPGIFSGGGGVTPGIFSRGQQIQLRTEGRENGDLGAVAP